MTEMLSIEEFLKLPGTVFDVRSPAEFSHARISGAVNLPLFSNSERAAVGTTYKQQGQEAAIQLGLELAGPKLANFVSQAKVLASQGIAKIHCWRGGMRSSAMAWLLKFSGLKTAQLTGGYKAFRRWALEQFSYPYRFVVIGGKTGSGKTAIIKTLQASGMQTIDLEFLAQHRGSTYGFLGSQYPQPSNEQFENDLALQLHLMNPKKPIWIEDESRNIGSCRIPNPIFNQMAKAPFILIETTLEERIHRLAAEYGCADSEELILASKRISKRLGNQRTKEIIVSIQQRRMHEAIILALQYYDSTYAHSLACRESPIIKIRETAVSFDQWPQLLNNYAKELA